MHKTLRKTMTAAAALALVACGDSGTGPGDGDGEKSTLTAVVDGSNFAPTKQAIEGSFVSGVFTFGASSTVDGITTTVHINLINVAGPASYEISPNLAAQFGIVTLKQGNNPASSWSTALSPGSGSVNLAVLNEEHASGTFQFTGQHLPGTAATGQLLVSSGTFDIYF